MAQGPDLKQYLDVGAQFVAMTRAEARRRAKLLVDQGQLAQEGVQDFIDDVVDQSRQRTDEMLDVVRKEIQRQVRSLGFATKDDLARLEARLSGRTTASRSGKRPAAKKSTKRGTAKQPAARGAGSAGAERSATKKSSAKKTAKRTTAKRSPAKRSPAKQATKRSGTTR